VFVPTLCIKYRITMKQTDNYRLKGRAVFLAAIMMMSVFAVPLAFAGGAAAAVTDNDADFDRAVTNGATVYQGQILIADVDNYDSVDQDNLELRRFNTDGDGKVGSLVAALTVEDGDTNEDYVIINTVNRNTGQYIITNQSNGGDPADDPNSITFEVVEQDLTVSFDDDEVADSGADAETTFEVESDARNKYAINVTADGLDAAELQQIFNASGDIGPDSSTESFAQNRSAIAQHVQASTRSVLTDDGHAIDTDDDVLTIFNGEREFEISFDDIDTDEYELEVEVVDSTASATASVTVADIGDGSLSFVEDAEIEQGGIAEITISAENADEGTLVIGDEDDVGYQANVSIDDFGDLDEITIYFNTYAAGSDELGEVLWLDSDDESDGAAISFDKETDQTLALENILATGDYELTVSAFTTAGEYDDRFERTLDEPDDVGSLFIDTRSTEDITVWTAADNSVDDLLNEDADDQPDAIAEAIENDLITPADGVAYDDYSVHQLEVSGLDGLLERANDELGGEATVEQQFLNLTQLPTGDNGDSAIQLRLRETRDSVGPNANRRVVNLSASDLVVVSDSDSNQYFLLIDTGEIEFENGNSLDAETDYEFDVRFELRDERLLNVDEEDDLEDFYQRVDTVFEVVEREAALDVNDEDLIEVEAAEEQEITGTTNIAPGSEVSIRVRGQGDARFSKSVSEIVVDADGTFAGVLDFSDRTPDDEFRATLRNTGVPDDNPQEDGIVVESVGEPVEDDDVDDEEVDDDDAVDENGTGDEPADDDEDPVDDETDDETPGFGVLVALVALLGAALLAVRRQN